MITFLHDFEVSVMSVMSYLYSCLFLTMYFSVISIIYFPDVFKCISFQFSMAVIFSAVNLFTSIGNEF